jgi:hypothetical protein
MRMFNEKCFNKNKQIVYIHFNQLLCSVQIMTRTC